MSVPLVPVITAGGLAALANAQGTGLQATIASIAIGEGALSGGLRKGYVPNSTMTALQGPMTTIPIISGSRLDPAGFRVRAILPATSPGIYTINEVGFVLSTGVLFALWSDPNYGLAPKTPLADVELALDILLEQIPTALLAISVVEPDIPDTTAVLAELLRMGTMLTTQAIQTEERLRGRGI